MDATHACDVAVHPETGELRILRYAAVHDVGRVFDRAIVEGQIRGGLVMGLSLAVGEVLDIEDGRVATTSLRQMNLPPALDGPEHCAIDLVESGLGLGPDGAKGIANPRPWRHPSRLPPRSPTLSASTSRGYRCHCAQSPISHRGDGMAEKIVTRCTSAGSGPT